MAYRGVSRMGIQEIIRRWPAGAGPRQIGSGTGLSRNTVRKYLSAARAEGITRDGPVATEEQLSWLTVISQSGPRQVATPRQDLLEPWADQIYQWIANNRLQMTRIQELLEARGCGLSYQSLRRFVVERNWRRRSKTAVRMEDTPPGEVPEADFGRLGMITDPETGRRKAVWAMVIIVITVCCATSGTASSGPCRASSWKMSSLDWKRRGLSPAGCPNTWSSTISPPRWCLEVAGQRIHGATRQKPLVVFQDEERHTLLPWDGEPYEIADWRNARVHPDHHIQCLQALYSVPSDVCPPGQEVEVKVDGKLVRIYHRGKLIKTHVRQPTGGRSADNDDYPQRRLPRRAESLHRQISGSHQAQRGEAGTGGG